jgi:hypothetical protein
VILLIGNIETLQYLDNHAINDGSLSFPFDPNHRKKSSETSVGVPLNHVNSRTPVPLPVRRFNNTSRLLHSD